MSRGRHARDGQRRDTWTRWRAEAAMTLRHPVASAHLWLRWWDWPVVRAHWLRQYRKADRAAFAALADHEPVPYWPAYLPAPAPDVMNPAQEPEQPPAPAAARSPSAAAPLPRPTAPISPGPGQHLSSPPAYRGDYRPTAEQPVLRDLPVVPRWYLSWEEATAR